MRLDLKITSTTGPEELFLTNGGTPEQWFTTEGGTEDGEYTITGGTRAYLGETGSGHVEIHSKGTLSPETVIYS